MLMSHTWTKRLLILEYTDIHHRRYATETSRQQIAMQTQKF